MDENNRNNTGFPNERTNDRTREFGSGSSNFGASGTGSSSSGVTGFNVQSGSDTSAETCSHCGQPIHGSSSIEQFLGKIGLSEDMITNLKAQMGNVDVEHYLDTARDYLAGVKTSGNKAKEFARENPGKVAAGVAVLAVGAGILLNSLRDREERPDIIVTRDETERR